MVRGSKSGRLGLAKQEEEWNKEVGRRVKRYGLALGVGDIGGRLLRSGWMKSLAGENSGVTTRECACGRMEKN